MHDIHNNVIELYNDSDSNDYWFFYNAYGTTKYFDDTDSLNVTNKWGYCDQLYDFETGRFISEDPVKDGSNWYSYCGGNPVVLYDKVYNTIYHFEYYKKLEWHI